MSPVKPLRVPCNRTDSQDVFDVARIPPTQRALPRVRVIPQFHVSRSMSYIMDSIQMKLQKKWGKLVVVDQVIPA